MIPHEQQISILIANGNVTRLGIRTTDGDFAAVKDGKTYGPKIENGSFYNMKLPMFDCQGSRIRLLVMEIPSTSARDADDAGRQAEAIRTEVAQKIPNLQSLFIHPQDVVLFCFASWFVAGSYYSGKSLPRVSGNNNTLSAINI